ncbi:hypothetical protein FRC01_003983 [Tulasnella sp. 417]|nr:hypothetical protein FRC01_003983 [Tulasnella sp. 417]
MPPLHEEIWFLIFQTLQNGVSRTAWGEIEYDNDRIKSVIPLTKTCRSFYRMCQPLLFKTIVINHSNRAECLASILESKPHLRNAVSKVHIAPDSLIPSETQDKVEKALMKLFSIRELWIWGVKISRALAGHFQQCPLLERLFLWKVTITDKEPTISSFRSLKSLRYKQGRANGFTTLSLPNLEALGMDSEFIDSDQLPLGTMKDHQNFQFSPTVLKYLTIFTPLYLIDSMQAGLLGLLGRANQIRSLTLPKNKFSDNFNVPNDLIPNLEIFDGPANLVLKFCKGRPVRDLRMSFPDRGIWMRADEAPSLLPPGSVPLEHLSIIGCMWEDDIMGYIAQHCPELGSLTIRAEYVAGPLSIRHPMPDLRSATFLPTYGPWYRDDGSGGKSESEARIVRNCKWFWTELEYLRLDPNYFWRYRDLEVERFEGEEVEGEW